MLVVKKSNVESNSCTGDLEVSFTEAVKHVKFQEIYSCIGKSTGILSKSERNLFMVDIS